MAAEIAKIHTIEWTPQLLYGEPLNIGMNSNWSGLFEQTWSPIASPPAWSASCATLTTPRRANQLYSAFAAGAGIVGTGNFKPYFSFLPRWPIFDTWTFSDADINGGTNHFGSPFNFPEEFVSVYRLHALLPDMIEYRDLAKGANSIEARVPIIDTFRGRATEEMHRGWTCQLGLEHGAAAAGSAPPPQPPAVPAELSTCARGSTQPSTWSRSTSSATASAAFRVSTSSAGRSG